MITENEFSTFNNCGIFKDINKECQVTIQDEVIEWIGFEKLNTLLKVIDKSNNELDIIVLREYTQLAIQLETGIEFNFAGF